MRYLIIGLFGMIVLFSCKEESAAPLSLPYNLEMKIEKSEDNEGLITVTAEAINANYFSIEFKDGENAQISENKEGIATHVFSKSGTYTVVVRAHATGDQFIKTSDTVNITYTDNFDENGIPKLGYSTPLSYDDYTLVWNDEFEGSALNTTDWNYEIGRGSGGWGNNELQYYLQENTKVNDGYLIITAKKQLVSGAEFTSSRLTTQGKKSFKYGRVDIRAALPKGQGMWPALWMLGDNISTVGWPKCGEIDIMEMVGGSATGKGDNKVHGTIHWDQNNERANYGLSTILEEGDFADEFHVFSIIWDEKEIRWFLDDKQFVSADITPANLSEFQEKFFFIFNVAVGGDWPGSPDESTDFPQRMIVDYIRVFQ